MPACLNFNILLPVSGSINREEMAPDGASSPHTNTLLACVLNVGTSSCAKLQSETMVKNVMPAVLINIHYLPEGSTNV